MIGEAGRVRVGFMFDRDRAPEELAGYAEAVERMGADDLWVVEDLGWAGSISATAMALAATENLRVGIGIAPVALRNPALLAMELATLARVHPGRVVAGVGHGVPEWMRRVGAETPRKLALLEESIVAVRALLAGETVNAAGEVTVDGLSLVHPPATVPPIVTGVVKPRSLELSGRAADGTILAEGAGPAQVEAALAHIGRGRESGSRPSHELIVFAYLQVTDAPTDAAREMVTAQAAWLGVAPESLFTFIGPAGTIPEKLEALRQAGADSVILRPLGPDPEHQSQAALTALSR